MQEVLEKLKKTMEDYRSRSIQLAAAGEAYGHTVALVTNQINVMVQQANEIPTKDEQVAFIISQFNEIPAQLHKLQLKASQGALTSSGAEAGVSNSIVIIEKHIQDEKNCQQQHENLLARVDKSGASQHRSSGERPESLKKLRNAVKELDGREETSGNYVNQDG